MRFIPTFASIATVFWATTATASQVDAQKPFFASPVSDRVLSSSYGTGVSGRYSFADDVGANVDRQAASLRNATIATWSIEFATPLIAANAVRAGLLD